MKSFLTFLQEETDPCWKGYKQYGTKQKNGKSVTEVVDALKTHKDKK